jgi:hypothetical protein
MNQKFWGMNRIGLEIIFEGKRLSYLTLPLPPPTCSEHGEPIEGGEIPMIHRCWLYKLLRPTRGAGATFTSPPVPLLHNYGEGE